MDNKQISTVNRPSNVPQRQQSPKELKLLETIRKHQKLGNTGDAIKNVT